LAKVHLGGGLPPLSLFLLKRPLLENLVPTMGPGDGKGKGKAELEDLVPTMGLGDCKGKAELEVATSLDPVSAEGKTSEGKKEMSGLTSEKFSSCARL
jgi:hypothetical protein